jgi:hypothetical protein
MYKILLVTETETVYVYKDGELVGTCEQYELDAIARFLEVQYEEEEE